MALKSKYSTSDFKPWKEKVLAKVKEKITDFKKKKPKQTKPILSDSDEKKNLEELHQKLVLATIDKTLNNFAFICRKYYISKLLAELSPNKKNKNSTSTCLQTQKCKTELIETNIKY